MNIRKISAAVAIASCIPATAPLVHAQGTALEEVIVSASRRMETAQETALAITAVTGESLAARGITTAQDLQTAVPGLTVGQAGVFTTTFIRGVGNFGADGSASSPITYNINGVPISRPSGVGPIFFDLQRVEVLKGPQGTLYGKNASGGAINLITNQPSHEFGGDFSIDLGNYDLRRFSGALNVPITDTLSMRLATQLTRRDGYLSDGANDQISDAARLLALWEPTDDLSVLMTAEWSNMRGKGSGAVPRSTYQHSSEDEWTGASKSGIRPSLEFLGGAPIDNDMHFDNFIRAISFEINYELPFATMTLLPAYRELDNKAENWGPGFFYPLAETSEQQTFEFRLSGDTERMEWVAGYFFLKERQTHAFGVNGMPLQVTTTTGDLDTETHAVFGEVTFDITDSLRGIAGVRYSHDDKGQDGVQTTTVPVFVQIPGYGRRIDEEVNWKVGLEYDLGPDNMLFATIATGYMSGGFIQSAPFPDNSYEPETMKAFTVGSRNRFFNNSLQANFELFYWDYKDKQERFVGPTPSRDGGMLLVTNAGSATIKGLEIDLVWQATPTDTIRFNTTYTDAEYDTFTYDTFLAAFAGLGGFSECALGTPQLAQPGNLAGPGSQSVDCSGMPLVRAPEWSGGISYQHVFDIGADNTLAFDVSGQFATEQYLTTDFIKTGRDDGYFTWDASLTLDHQGQWFVTLWGRNLTDEAVYSGGFKYIFNLPEGTEAFFPPGAVDPSLLYADIRAPRTYGMSFGMSF